MRSIDTARAIRARISAGDYEPGAKLNEVALAAEHSVSRNTLREAFVMLAHQGVVTRIPNRGVFLSEPDAAEVADVYRARGSIEPTALTQGEFLDPAAMRAKVEEARAAHAAGDLRTVAFTNQGFHRAIVAAHGSAHLDELMNRLLATMRLAFLEVLRVEPEFHVGYIEKNERVASLVEAGHRQEAAAELAAQLRQTSATIQAIL